MRHTLFVLIVAVYALALGQTLTHYAAALLIAAYRMHGGRLFSPLEVS